MSRTKIGLSMLFCLGEPFKSLLKHLDEVNVDAVEILDEGLHALNTWRIKSLRKVIASLGIEVTVHAPFADINIASPIPSFRRIFLKRLEKSISYAHQIGCQLWIFHPGIRTGISNFYPGLEWEMNLDSARKLLRISEKKGVEIAIENVPEPFPFLMKNVHDFSLFYKELGEHIGLVLDVGHANLSKQIESFISLFSKKIVHMHLSDNDGDFDSHLGIGCGNIDWESFSKAVIATGYSNILMLESTEHLEESLQTIQYLFTETSD
jgi:sugar phosphate isomerase/epimerase